MRKTVWLATVLVVLSSCAGAKGPVKGIGKVTELENAGYSQGYKEGYREGFNASYGFEKKVILQMLKLWRRDVLAYEVGRYAVNRSIVAPPKIYREGNGQVGSIETGGQYLTPAVVEKLSVLAVPSPYFPETPSLKVPQPDRERLSVYPVPYRIGYLKGFSDGEKKGLTDGKERALREFQKALSPDTESGKKFLYLELEKYYSPDLKITYPRVYQVSRGNRVYYFLVPSRVENVRSWKDVLNGKVPLPSELKKEKKPDGVRLPVQATPVQLPSSSVPVPVKVRVSCKELSVVSSYGAGVMVENDSCWAVFTDRTQKEVFCEKTGLCKPLKEQKKNGSKERGR